ncbi:trypsin-like serine peptidase [Streptomyces sp. NPDC091406]|uniref:trypsin-like serine peptidase n=1 Tax=unclassified Streptomyces TaxID=2593676 RepID=UPI0037F1FE2F
MPQRQEHPNAPNRNRKPGPPHRSRTVAWLITTAFTAASLLGLSSAQLAAARPNTPDQAAVAAAQARVTVPGSAGRSPAEQEKALLAFWTPERMKETVAARPSAGESPAVPAEAASDTVGKLFFRHPSGKADHCTAAAVDTGAETLVMTAAHCLHGGPGASWMRDIVFAPAYHNGDTPLGTFPAWNIATDSLWSSGSTPDWEHDYGIVITHDNAVGEHVVDAAGGFQVVNDARTGENVSIMGYSGPPYDGEHQEHCEDLIEPTAPPTEMWQVYCPNMAPGSSGAPWLLDYDAAEGIGYLAGLNSISDTGGFLASPRFDSRTTDFVALMDQLAAARPEAG